VSAVLLVISTIVLAPVLLIAAQDVAYYFLGQESLLGDLVEHVRRRRAIRIPCTRIVVREGDRVVFDSEEDAHG
jgi:hypothetical protein